MTDLIKMLFSDPLPPKKYRVSRDKTAICSHLFHLAFNDHYKIILIVIIIKTTKQAEKRITLCLLLCLQLSVFSSKAISKTYWRVLD